MIVPIRWVDTDKSDGNLDDNGAPLPREAKSRLVVVGFRDKLLGLYRHNAHMHRDVQKRYCWPWRLSSA